jgi:hypothetical protein
MEPFDYLASIATGTRDVRTESAVRAAYEAMSALNDDCGRPALLGPHYSSRRPGLCLAS